jgi:DNA-binding XRE family transcriptional regulator
LGYEPEEVASRVGLNRPSYYDLEACEDELTMCVSLGEIARLETVLNFDVRNVFGHWTDSRKLTLQNLAELINAHLQTAKQTLDEFENAVGW